MKPTGASHRQTDRQTDRRTNTHTHTQTHTAEAVAGLALVVKFQNCEKNIHPVGIITAVNDVLVSQRVCQVVTAPPVKISIS